MAQMAFYASNQGLPFVITDTVSTPEQDKKLGRQTLTHQEGRAFDLSARGWSQADVKNVTERLTKMFGEYAAISSETLKPELVVYHKTKTGAYHFHVQIHKRYARKQIYEQLSTGRTAEKAEEPPRFNP